jgi:two-component system, LytTR family, response regulator
MSLKTLIVDDEPLAREGLRMLLSEDPEISAIAEARNGIEAVSAIRQERPDLVFLDMQMPEMDGMAVVRTIGAPQMPPTIFVTAHDQYAIQAFETNAIDYLLKPVTAGRFAHALERAKTRIRITTPDSASRQILSLLETLSPSRRYCDRLAVRSRGKTLFVDVSDIDWIEAAENYVHLHTGTKNHLLTATMNAIEKSLDPDVFVRIHRSVILNVKRIKEIQPSLHGEYAVTLQDGTVLQSGRLYREKLKHLTSNPF